MLVARGTVVEREHNALCPAQPTALSVTSASRKASAVRPFFTQSSFTMFSPPQLSVSGTSTTQQIQFTNATAFIENNVMYVRANVSNIKIVITPPPFQVTVRRGDGVLINVSLNPAPLIPGPSEIPLPPTPVKNVCFADSELTRKEKDELDEDDALLLYGIQPQSVQAAMLRKAKKIIAGPADFPDIAALRARKKGKRVSFQEARVDGRNFDDW